MVTRGPLTIDEGGPPAALTLQATMPPALICRAANLTANLTHGSPCSVTVAAYVEVVNKDKCSGTFIPQAAVGE